MLKKVRINDILFYELCFIIFFLTKSHLHSFQIFYYQKLQI